MEGPLYIYARRSMPPFSIYTSSPEPGLFNRRHYLEKQKAAGFILTVWCTYIPAATTCPQPYTLVTVRPGPCLWSMYLRVTLNTIISHQSNQPPPEAQSQPAERWEGNCTLNISAISPTSSRLVPVLQWPDTTYTTTLKRGGLAHMESLSTAHSEGGLFCSPCISGRVQAANYKTTLGAWLFIGIAAVLLHAEWGKWTCQSTPKLVWWVRMR